MTARHTRRSTLAACVAQLAGCAVADVPLEWDDLRPWLGGRGLGLVAVAEPAGFSWAGPWLAVRAARAEGVEPLGCLLFGVPPGPIFDPGETEGPALEGWVLAPLDVAIWTPPRLGEPGTGVVEAIVIAADAGAPSIAVDAAVAVPGRGLEGDRYAAGTGTFGSGRPGSALTLVAAEELDDLDHRRNLVVRGLAVNALVGRDFTVGEVACRGQRLAEPCARLAALNGAAGTQTEAVGRFLRPLVHRAGLRADILAGGTIRVGDPVAVAPRG